MYEGSTNEGAALDITSQDVLDQLMTWWWYRHEADAPDGTPPGHHQAAAEISYLHLNKTSSQQDAASASQLPPPELGSMKN